MSTLKNSIANKKPTPIWLRLIAFLPFIGSVVWAVFYVLSGFGLCEIGEFNYFANTRNQTCAPFGSKITPLPDTVRSLKIIDSHWNGWTVGGASGQPEKITTNTALNPTLTHFALKGWSSDQQYQLNVESYSDTEIKLTITGLRVIGVTTTPPSTTTSVLDDCKGKKTFTLLKEQSAQLSTCSMDMGATWELEYQ